MSFRARLTVFFVLIVVAPMASVSILLFEIIDDNAKGKADARVSARQDAAIGAVKALQRRADGAAEDIGADPRLAAALRADDRPALRARTQQLLRRERAKRILITRGDEVLASAGTSRAVFPTTRVLQDASRREFGRLQVAVQGPREYAEIISGATGLGVAVVQDGDVLATTVPALDAGRVPPGRSVVEVDGRSFRASKFFVPSFARQQTGIVLLEPGERFQEDVSEARLLAGSVMAAFFLLAFGCAMLVSRSLQRQIGAFLDAARRLGNGDFSAKVPTAGRDEFAALGQEFNKMGEQLAARLEDLASERARLQGAVRRIGESFAVTLDKEATLELVVETARDAVTAQAGRATIRPRPGAALREVAAQGDLHVHGDALRAAEAQVLETGAPASAEVDGVVARAHPLRGVDGAEAVTGTVAVARRGAPFSDTEREIFDYLAVQASVSVENAGLHETVERQAVTDELTGLSNRRRFDEALATEAERTRRFGQPLALLLLDIDNFKKVNDTHGHQQGDLVLQEVARILRESCREIDEPARYGGEELAAVLPNTDLEGAWQLAERVREQLEALDISMRPGARRRKPMRVTASFGVATMPATAEDVPGLVAAADEALYRAKTAGKNRVERAAVAGRVPGD